MSKPFIFTKTQLGKGEFCFMESIPNVQYLLSVHYLKKLREKGFITYEQFDEIDRLNRYSFLKSQGKKTA